MGYDPNLFNLPGSGPPNYVDPPNDAKHAIIVSIVLLGIAVLLVCLKSSIHAFKDSRRWTLHDVFVACSLACAIAEVVMRTVEVFHFGIGRHMKDIPLPLLKHALPLHLNGDIPYILSIMFTKLSVLAFYLNIFSVQRWFRWLAYSLACFIALYCFAFVMLLALICVSGSCVNEVPAQYVVGSFNSATDAIILVMPFPLIFKLRMSVKRKVMLGAVFALGAFTTAAAITRTVIIGSSLRPIDASWNVYEEILWENIEMLVGLICSSLFAMPRLFRLVRDRTSIGRSVQSLLHSEQTEQSPTQLCQVGTATAPKSEDLDDMLDMLEKQGHINVVGHRTGSGTLSNESSEK